MLPRSSFPIFISFRWRLSPPVSAFLLAVLASFYAHMGIAESRTLEYSLEKEGKFHVLYSRAAGSATGAALGGLLGASIQAGVENGKDAKKEKEVLEHLESSACAPLFEESFLESLAEAGDYSIVDKPVGKAARKSAADASVRVELTIDRCGFKLVNSERMFVAAFAEARYRIYSPTQPKPKKASRLLLLGKEHSTWDGLLNDKSEISFRFERVLEKAGKRLANKVIYFK